MNPASTSLFQNLRALPRPVWFLFAGTFLNKFGSFVIPFLAIYLRKRGFSDGQAALAMLAYGVGHLIASGLGGYLADTIGRRKTITLSMFSSAASMLLLSQANEFSAILAMSSLTGLTTELYRPASAALLADLVPAEQRVTAFAALRWAVNAGFACGAAIGGFLLEHSFLGLFVGDAITSILFGTLAWFALPHGVRATAHDSNWSEAFRVMRHDRRLHKLLLAQFAIALVFLQMTSTFGLHVTSQGFSTRVYGGLIALNGIMIICLELPITAFTRRWPTTPTIATGFAVIGFAFTGLAVATTLPALATVVVVLTIGEMIAMPISSSYIAGSLPPAMRGRYMGMFGLMWALGLIVGPSIGLWIQARQPLWLWGSCGALGSLAAILVLLTTHERPRG